MLRQIAEELNRQKDASVDLIANTGSIRAYPDEESGIVLSIEGYGAYPMNEWAHGQLAEKCGIPKKYYDKMRKYELYGLLADNVNAFIPEKEKRLIRILDDNVRAFLSDRYKTISNYELFYMALEEFKQAEAKVYNAQLTDTMMYIRALDPNLVTDIGKEQEDIINGGLIIRNSEVGASSLRVEPFILRIKCSNGIIGEHSLKKIHLGAELEEGMIRWSDYTRHVTDEATKSQVKDVIHSAFDPVVFNEWADKLRGARDHEFVEPTKVVDKFTKDNKLSDNMKENLLMHFEEPNQFGLVNAITRTARDLESPDKRAELEAFAGKTLQIEPKKLGDLREAAEA